MLESSLVAVARERPLVLVFEDVHWSDYSTLDLLSALAHGREPARLLVVCTLRPADAIARSHPVMAVERELLRKGLCREILLGGLSPADVADYLEARFPAATLPSGLLPLLVERSDGNPFFVVTLVDHLLESGVLVEGPGGWRLRGSREGLRTAIPDGLRAVLEPRLERLRPEELRVLEAASVAGLEFAAHAVAGTARPESELADVETVEQLCDGLARRQEIVRQSGEVAWPDGRRSALYAFRHALYQQVLDQGLAPSLRRRLHQSIGEQLERGYAGHTEEVASALAAHFERSGDLERAVRYHGEAAARARSRFAFRETRLHVESALRLMRQQPEDDEALSRQMPLLDDLGWASFVHDGWGDEGAARAFAQMRELAGRLDAAAERFKAMQGALIVHAMRADYATARQRGEEMLRLAEEAGTRDAMGAALPLAATYLSLGELEAAGELGERIRALLDMEEPTIDTISCCQLLASIYAHRGLVARAREMNREAVALAARAEAPYLRALAATYTAAVYAVLRDPVSARPLAEQAIHLAGVGGFSVLPSLGGLFRAWCDVFEGRGETAAAAMAASGALDEYVASGQRISISAHSLPVVEAHLAAGDVPRALEVLQSTFGFVAATNERSYEHELLRLRGECLLADGVTPETEAIACFERAIDVAEQQGARLYELRATASLHRRRPEAARERLERLVAAFAPEDDCVDLREASALLRA